MLKVAQLPVALSTACSRSFAGQCEEARGTLRLVPGNPANDAHCGTRTEHPRECLAHLIRTDRGYPGKQLLT
jgi:hypothetical protein